MSAASLTQGQTSGQDDTISGYFLVPQMMMMVTAMVVMVTKARHVDTGRRWFHLWTLPGPKILAENISCFSTREKRDTGQIGHGTQRWLYSHSLPRPSQTKCSIIRTDIRGAAPHHKGTVVGHKMFGWDTGPLNWDTGTPGVGGTPRGDG